MTTPDPIDYDVLAWDISDAIAKSMAVDPNFLDVDMYDIRPALPAFIATIRANATGLSAQKRTP